MGDVVDFSKEKQEREPHAEGLAKCMQCGHEWHAVAPVGQLDLDCPSCGTYHGVFKGQFVPEGQLVYFCECRNDLFNQLENGFLFCPHCGTTHDPEED